MIAADPPRNPTLDRQADWELDFYSRPILEPDGKKRWELLISSTPELGGGEAFRYARRCPAGEVNSTWLTEALRDAMTAAEADGWRAPRRLRSWRSRRGARWCSAQLRPWIWKWSRVAARMR